MDGALQSMNAKIPTMTGPVTATHRVTTTRAERRSSATLGWAERPGRALRRIGPMRPKRSGTPTRSATTKYPSRRPSGSSCWRASTWTKTMASKTAGEWVCAYTAVSPAMVRALK